MGKLRRGDANAIVWEAAAAVCGSARRFCNGTVSLGCSPFFSSWAACGLLCAAALTVNQAYAQAWPSRPIKVVVPFLAGSATDVTARLISERLAEYLGVSFVVENKPGAGGNIGTDAVAKAEPDGYTLS